MDRGSAKAVIAVTYFLGCMCLLTQGLMDFGSAALAVLIFISGMCINGAQMACRPTRRPTIRPKLRHRR
jgi:hypothetical protein